MICTERKKTYPSDIFQQNHAKVKIAQLNTPLLVRGGAAVV